MNGDVLKLMELQKLDNERKRLGDEMLTLPKAVADLEKKAAAVRGQRAVVLDLLAKEETMRRSQQSDVQDHTGKIARLRKQMDLATTAVQVSAYQHEIEFAQAAIAKLEDAELESMERTEALDAQRARADAAVAAAEQTHAREQDRGQATVASDRLALVGVDQARETARAGIGEASLAAYDRIARAKGTGVAEALNGKCLACQMMVRPQRWNDLRDRDNRELFTCESCGRLLWYDPARDAPQRKPAEGESAGRTESGRTESIAARIVRGL